MRFFGRAAAAAWGRERIAAGFWDSLMSEVEVLAGWREGLVVEFGDLKMDGVEAGLGAGVAVDWKENLVMETGDSGKRGAGAGVVAVAVARVQMCFWLRSWIHQFVG